MITALTMTLTLGLLAQAPPTGDARRTAPPGSSS